MELFSICFGVAPSVIANVPNLKGNLNKAAFFAPNAPLNDKLQSKSRTVAQEWMRGHYQQAAK
eukprot:7269110-Alexandrium_andersonii.AAC.1